MYIPDSKILFLHAQKCAGASIKTLLKKHRPDYIIPKGSTHWNAYEWKREIGNDFDSYFKIGSVRNPWDRAVSYYYHAKTHHQELKQLNFKDFILSGRVSHPIVSLYYKFHFCSRCVVDHFVRKEHVVKDMKVIYDKLGIENSEIENRTHESIRPNREYKHMYDDMLIDAIASCSQWEIDRFGYTFD